MCVGFFLAASIAMKYTVLSYDVAVIQWITPCHKNRINTRVITLWRVQVTPLRTSMSGKRRLIGKMIILKAIKSKLKGSYDKQNLSLNMFYFQNCTLQDINNTTTHQIGSKRKLISYIAPLLNLYRSYPELIYNSSLLNSWSFHMKFMKLAEGSFHKFHIK